LTHATRKDPAAELRKALVAALVDVPVSHSLADRRLLINLVRRDVRTFPDVPERDQARTHVIEIVLACISTRGGLRALKEALVVMAPEAPGTRLTCSLVDSASLASLLLQGESQQAHELLRRAAHEMDDPEWWRAIARDTLPGAPQPADLVQMFEYAAGRSAGDRDAATALTMVHRVAADLEGPLRVELTTWVEQVAERLELLDNVLPRPGSPAGEYGAPPDGPPDPALPPDATSELSPFTAPLGPMPRPCRRPMATRAQRMERIWLPSPTGSWPLKSFLKSGVTYHRGTPISRGVKNSSKRFTSN
jgi:hypothetical protein